VGDFAVAYTGVNNGNNGEGIVLNSGLFADEFISTDYFSSHVEIDTRKLTVANSSNNGVTRNLLRARTSAEATAKFYADVGQPNAVGRAWALNLAGMVYTIVAEDYCSGVPFSSIDSTGRKEYGAPKSTLEMLATAVARFDSARAIADAAGSSEQAYLSQVGKGRALLDAGQFAAAAAAVSGVPLSYDFSTEQGTSDDRTKSGIYDLTYLDTRYTVADGEGGNGLPFVSAADPRVPIDSLGISAFDGATSLYPTSKYNSYSSPTPIATGAEAQLIRAEAALRGGDYGTALQLLNDLRASAGYGPLLGAGTPAAQQDQLFAERAFWLFGTAHRLGDMRRLVAQYGRTASTVYPVGNYFKGGSYGTQLSLLVPQDEEQNPSFSRAACDPTKP
jgi:hypothetical protein